MLRGVGKLEMIRRGPRDMPHRPALLLVHGAWHAAWCWDRGFMDMLADRGHEVVAVSLRGHGGSAGCDPFGRSWHGLRDYVDDVAAAADELGRPAVIVGHSMGGFVAQRFLCERRPALGAVLLAPVPPTGVLPLFLRLLRSEPVATARAVATLDLGHLLRDPDRAARLLFSETIDRLRLATLHPLLGGESFRVFLELIAPRLRPEQAVASVAVLAAGADALFTSAEALATAAAWSTRASIFDGMGHDMMLAPGWEAVAIEVSLRATKLASSTLPPPPSAQRPGDPTRDPDRCMAGIP